MTSSRSLEGHSEQLTIWTGKESFKKIDLFLRQPWQIFWTLGYLCQWHCKTCVHDEYCINLHLKWREQHRKHISTYALVMKVMVMIFCIAMSQGMRV